MAAVTICSDFAAQKNKVWWGGQSIEASALASVLPMNIQGWLPLGLTSFITLLSKGLSRISLDPFCFMPFVVSSAYLRTSIFLLAILIPACASTILAFHMTYSAYKLNKQVTIYSLDVLLSQFWTTVVPCLVLTIASWPEYRFLRGQVRWSVIYISLRIFHCLLWFTQKKALS